MKETVLKISLTFLTFGFILILADCYFARDIYSSCNFGTHGQSADLAGHVEHSHSHCFQVNIAFVDSNPKQNISTGEIKRIPKSRFVFENRTFSNIWQPPKFS